MSLRHVIACSLLFALMAACSDDRVADVQPARNPQPIAGWRIEFLPLQHLDDLSVKPRASYSIGNPDCIPLDHTRALGGVRPSFQKHAYPQILEGMGYTFIAHDDYFIDADHYGLGICNWRLAGADFEISHAGVSYVVGIGRSDVIAESTVDLDCSPFFKERRGSCRLAGRGGTLKVRITSRMVTP